jgi:hypothetical protein
MMKLVDELTKTSWKNSDSAHLASFSEARCRPQSLNVARAVANTSSEGRNRRTIASNCASMVSRRTVFSPKAFSHDAGIL